MNRNGLTMIVVALVGAGAGYLPKAETETDLTVAPWAIALENRGVKTTPAPGGGTYSVKKAKIYSCKFLWFCQSIVVCPRVKKRSV